MTDHFKNIVLILCIITSIAGAQSTDSTRTTDAPLPLAPLISPLGGDTTRTLPDSLLADSTLAAAQQPAKSDLDTTIYYDAESIFTNVGSRTTTLTGKAVIKYKNITLKAEKITLNWNDYLITAEPVADSVWVVSESDTAGTDSSLQVTWKGMPELNEGGSPYTGDKMMYNYKTEKGIVVRGRTELEGGFYTGQQIKRVNKDVFNITNSSYTTCDLDSNPHFHFESHKLKMIMKDKAIAKPVVMYMGKIPIAAIPFAIFPIKTGRQSGILLPTYGESAQEGRFLRGLGYYWAPSDFFDANLRMDYFEKSGYLFRGGSNYNVRYLLNGSITGSYTRKDYNNNKTKRWDLRLNHKQDIDPTSRVTVTGYFVSDKDFYKNYSTNLNTRLTRELRSNATYSKSWSKHKLSLSVNMSQVHDLQDDVTDQIFPQVSFRKGQSQLFKPGKKSTRGRSSGRRKAKWYESLYFSYNSSLINQTHEYLAKNAAGDTLKQQDKTRKMTHDLSFSLTSPKKYFGWLSLNQSLSISDDWFDETQNLAWNAVDTVTETNTDKGFAARHTFNYQASANTKLYGMFAPGIGDIQAIRHVITPSVSFTYQPDFSDSKWGYFSEIETPNGTERIDRFGGGTPTGGRKSVSLGVQNLFQMKKGYGEKEKKIDLFSMNFNTGYNFEAEKNKLSNLSTSWRANPASNFSLSASTTHSFYQWIIDDSHPSGYRSNVYMFENGGWQKGNFLQLTNFRLNFSLRLKGSESKTDNKKNVSSRDLPVDEEPDPLLDEDDLSVLEEDLVRRSNRFENEMAIRSFAIPWQASLSFAFNLNKSDPNNTDKSYYMDIQGAEINLTRKWRIGYTAHYDIEKKQISYHSFTFYRDLHCWEGSIDWVPSGPSKRVYAIIRIRSDVLRDVKIEKRGGAQSVLGY